MNLIAATLICPLLIAGIVYVGYRVYRHISEVREEQIKQQRLNAAFDRANRRRKGIN